MTTLLIPIVVAILAMAMVLAFALVTIRTLRREVKRKTAELYVRNEEFEQEKAERRRAEDSLRLTEQTYRAMFANTRDMVFVHGITPEGLPSNFLDVNDVACKKLGYDREKLLTLTPMDIEAVQIVLVRASRDRGSPMDEIKQLTEESVERDNTLAMRRFMRTVTETGNVLCDRTYVSGSGRQIPVEVSVLLFDLSGRPMVMCTAHDITQRKESERALRDSERLFHDFFANSPLGAAMFDAQRVLVDVNQSFLKMLGLPDRQAFARMDLLACPFLPPGVAAKLAGGEFVRCEMTLDFDVACKRNLLLSTRKGTAHFEMIFDSLGVDAEFKAKGFIARAVDITKRMQTEEALRNSEKKLQQAQKMQAIGTLAGGIAHDFNNILTPIIGYAEIALDAVEEPDALRGFIQEIHKAGNRAKDLVRQILTFSRQSEDESQRKPVRVAPIVKEVLAQLQTAWPANVEISRVIKTESDVVLADPTQIHQVFMNLCTNARHALGQDGGQIEVRMTDFVMGGRSRSEFPTLEAGRYLRVSIKDSGCGMEPATLERVFEPFFSTRKIGEGTGLGLSVVHGIVTSLSGAITVETEPGKGSTFHVILPVLEQVSEEAKETDTQPMPKGNEFVLFVDDDAEVAKLASHLLSSLGYQPVTAAGPQAALEILKADPQRFSVVVTDQLMPGMAGTELAREIHVVRPDIPIVLCSGFADGVSPEQAAMAGIRAFLPKPLVRRTLADVLRQAIEGRTRSPDSADKNPLTDAPRHATPGRQPNRHST